ncbi:50S ribosomal protein L17 [Megalodesulfovibrio gigas]|uniref:Large ribosomal subunit protein bL17 n=1 Tax=Megalodesulfovibrio gigas (strain ATCC 19364 / DSM 1382 / NCIMB 9332 / VKM B-1759) TaxID=1121448 RepID=T2GD74_MEGG1|nr:50S ribosomal protein L17 [Megalodesulfovibrio gigas]AGW14535.1 putative ribosomal protein L17 [Megalodesulfovibrio gigas DSM 1382 = ATCC 19364]
MRHNKRGRKLGRTWEHRKALLRNMAKALIIHGRIQTTEAKAKELRPVADKLVTLALRNDLHSRRLAYKVLGNHGLVKTLFDEIGPRFAAGGGGYTRVVRMSQPRTGDCAPMAIIEFTRYEGDIAAPKAKKEAPAAAPAPAPAAAPAAAEAAAEA